MEIVYGKAAASAPKTASTRPSAGDDKLSENILTAVKGDPLMLDLFWTYGLYMEFVMPGVTFLRPSDAILRKHLEEMKKLQRDDGDPKFVKQRLQMLRYFLKGGITPSSMHASHWYVSRADRAYVIYMEGTKIAIHDSEVADTSKQMRGAMATLSFITRNGSSVFLLDGDMPEGVAPRRDSAPRRPLDKPFRLPGALYGGGLGCTSCELVGAGYTHEAHGRFKLMEVFRNGSENPSTPGFGDDAGKAVVPAFMAWLKRADNVPGMYEAVLALMTGNMNFDLVTILESTFDTPDRPANSSHIFLVPNETLDAFADYFFADHKKAVATGEKFASLLGKQLNHSGANEEYTKLRLAYVQHMRSDIDKTGSDDKARLAFIKNSLGDVSKQYENVGKSNQYTYESKTATAFEPAAHGYLQDRFGSGLGTYLAWHDLSFLAFETVRSGSFDSRFDVLVELLPGENRAKEVSQALEVNDGSFAAHFLVGGFANYLRASVNALSSASAVETARGYLIGGGLSPIDTAYRVFGDWSTDASLMEDNAPAGVLTGGGSMRAVDVVSNMAGGLFMEYMSATNGLVYGGGKRKTSRRKREKDEDRNLPSGAMASGMLLDGGGKGNDDRNRKREKDKWEDRNLPSGVMAVLEGGGKGNDDRNRKREKDKWEDRNIPSEHRAKARGKKKRNAESEGQDVEFIDTAVNNMWRSVGSEALQVVQSEYDEEGAAFMEALGSIKRKRKTLKKAVKTAKKKRAAAKDPEEVKMSALEVRYLKGKLKRTGIKKKVLKGKKRSNGEMELAAVQKTAILKARAKRSKAKKRVLLLKKTRKTASPEEYKAAKAKAMAALSAAEEEYFDSLSANGKTQKRSRIEAKRTHVGGKRKKAGISDILS